MYADDSEWRAGSFRYANAHFYDTLRSWPRCRDVKESTPPDWRVSAEDPFGGNRTAGGVCGAYGHDMSTNDADGWKRSSVPYVESTFRGGLRDYKGVDVGYTEEGGVKKQGDGKEKKHMAGTNLGNIYRSSKQCNCLSTARADEHFLGSLRSESRKSTDDYQRTRRANLNLPQFSSLTPEQLTKAKRVFATIDTDDSGTIDAEELRKFLTGLGHRTNDKAVKKLLKAADDGVSDCKASLMEFCRLYHGLKL